MAQLILVLTYRLPLTGENQNSTEDLPSSGSARQHAFRLQKSLHASRNMLGTRPAYVLRNNEERAGFRSLSQNTTPDTACHLDRKHLDRQRQRSLSEDYEIRYRKHRPQICSWLQRTRLLGASKILDLHEMVHACVILRDVFDLSSGCELPSACGFDLRFMCCLDLSRMLQEFT